MAKAASSKRVSSKKDVAPPPATPNRERPSEPKRHQADKAELLEYYRQMLLIRRFEERAGQLYGLGLIGGFCHLYIGQEAVAVGLQSALERLTLVPIAYWLFSITKMIGSFHSDAMLNASYTWP